MLEVNEVGPLIVKESASGYSETATRLGEAIRRRGLTRFARIDHAAAARRVGLELAPEEVLIFGNPQAGTGLMQRDPRVGYELPLRMLVWQEGKRVLVGYRDPSVLADSYDVGELQSVLNRMAMLLDELAAEAAGDGPPAP
jgi:uncharacterized protein (DUF302 family)